MNTQTNSSELWNKIRSFKGLNRNQKIQITDEHGPISTPEEVTEKIGRYFHINFSNTIYKQLIDEIKTNQVKRRQWTIYYNVL